MPSVLDSQSLGAGFDARMEVYLSVLFLPHLCQHNALMFRPPYCSLHQSIQITQRQMVYYRMHDYYIYQSTVGCLYSNTLLFPASQQWLPTIRDSVEALLVFSSGTLFWEGMHQDSMFHIYADNILLYHIIHSPADYVSLQQSIESIVHWSYENSLTLNHSKCKYIYSSL